MKLWAEVGCSAAKARVLSAWPPNPVPTRRFMIPANGHA